jgi:hypothetical protein
MTPMQRAGLALPVYVDAASSENGDRSSMEESMLDFASDVRDNRVFVSD